MTSRSGIAGTGRLFRHGTSIQEVTGEVVRIMITGLVKLGILQRKLIS